VADIRRLSLECKHCQSGYRVDPSGKHNFCGFCGARLKGLDAKLITNDTLIYIDSDSYIEVEVKLRNVGVLDAVIDRIEIS
jgi:hypothetical protein